MTTKEFKDCKNTNCIDYKDCPELQWKEQDNCYTKKMEKGKCKYCGKEITPSSIRCMECDVIWNEGRKHGRLEIKSKLKEIFGHLNSLIDLGK